MQSLRLPLLLVFSLFAGISQADKECVVLLHGLARVSNSMSELETKLTRSGFEVANISYPSRRLPPASLAIDAVGRGIQECEEQDAESIHFVTHSLGGILVRIYFEQQRPERLGRVVMLGPPNHGSELVDSMSSMPGFGFLGPAGKALGTGKDGMLDKLGPADFDLGVIAGDFNINPLGFLFIDGPNDSVVSVESTKLAGMNDHRVLPVIHNIMMRDNEVIDQTIHYLKTGSFIPE